MLPLDPSSFVLDCSRASVASSSACHGPATKPNCFAKSTQAQRLSWKRAFLELSALRTFEMSNLCHAVLTWLQPVSPARFLAKLEKQLVLRGTNHLLLARFSVCSIHT